MVHQADFWTHPVNRWRYMMCARGRKFYPLPSPFGHWSESKTSKSVDGDIQTRLLISFRSIPSYSDQHQYLSDEHLYPQQLNTMYAAPTSRYPTYNPAEQPRSTYLSDQSQSQSQYNQQYSDQNSLNSQPLAVDFRPGSFADVGAAFGYNPDLPIQLTSQQLPQSPTSMMPVYHTPFPNNNNYGHVNLNQNLFGLPLQNNLGHVSSQDWQRSGEHNNPKRVRRSDDSDEENDQYEAHRPTRLPGACVHCKNLKVKCEFIPGHDVCNRCRSGKKECRVMGRKPRRPPPKREDLLNRIRDQETTIQDLRAKLEAAHISHERQPSYGPSAESALSPSSAHTPEDPAELSVQDKDIQAWIEKARESAQIGGAAGDLDPSVVSAADAPSEREESEDGDDEHLEVEVFERAASAGLGGSVGDGGLTVTRSPAVGTTLSPIGLLASTALRSGGRRASRRGSTTSLSADGNKEVGLANPSYFLPGISTNPGLRWAVRESQPPPKIFSRGLVSPREIDKLFEIFFDRMNLSVSLLDPVIYTAQTTYWRSPFLFTVNGRPGLYSDLMSFAKLEAGQALVAGLKSVELVAGYILLSLYPVPSARWEEDRGWLMLGVAIRMATDLNLQHSWTAKVTTEAQRREVANRTRIWINCYNLDRSTSTQFGKPSTIKEDYIARRSKFWYRTTGFNYDIHLNGYTQLLRVMAKFHEAIYSDPDQPTGLNMTYEQELLEHWQEWEPIFAAEEDKSLHFLYRIELLRLANAYSRLVILSFRFQNAFQNGLSRGDPFLQKCLDTASSVVQIVVDNMAPHPFLRTAPDAQFVFASFASVFLLKLLRPRFGSVLEAQQKENIVILIGRLIDVLQSDNVAIDERHSPKLYARFLEGLLERHKSGLRSARSSIQPSEASEVGGFTVTIEQPQTTEIPQDMNPYPTYPIVTPPSPRNPSLAAPASYIHDGASSVSDTIAARSHASTGIPETTMTDFNFTNADDVVLAPMRAITNPGFWEDMMMPGFSWTPTETPAAPDFFQQFAAAVETV
ncbi:hypothetical protein BU17DRAFT_70933 [Hysterangium stoloniferum]|nr:hypothetical protein BU17DRAFT_70933 [Hysterangium stoloniferum]